MTEDEPRDTPEELPTEQFGPDSPTLDLPSEEAQGGSASPTISIPNYRILGLVGFGGMGEVYEAEQERPIRRKVAIKVVKLGMDSRSMIARFESERQALALMNHPNIAKVFDAGTTEEGRPFFALEFVQGESILSYCDRHRLGIPERLELFMSVCDGVQHAHQKGIIHRDLKPSNVLVAIQDDKPATKIIDFGVAKAIGQQLTEETLHTRMGAMVGTVEYMSPEQAEMTGLDVDTRTDVYALGVLLYELLAGDLPFGSKRLRRSGIDEIRRIIREDEPPKPSTRLSDSESPALAKQVHGDLDWITLKALEKDRTRRYQTANALAMDIRRHLTHEPVLASPPSAVYRLKKFMRRHRAGMAAALIVTLAVIVGTMGTTAGLIRALRAERNATEEAAAARQVSDFLVDLFRVSDPQEAQGETITARQILDVGAERIFRELRDQPLTHARLMDTIGTVYGNLGLLEESADLLESALEARQALLEGDSLEVAESLHNLAVLYELQGHYLEGQAFAQRALSIREAELGPEDPKVADSLMAQARNLVGRSEHAQATPLFERALSIRETALGPEDSAVAESRSSLAITHWRQGNFEAAERLLLEALATYERALGPNDYRISSTLNDLAIFYWSQDRLVEAEPLLERAIAIKERVLGADHPSLANSLNNLALIYDEQGRADAAEPLVKRALAILEEKLGSEHDTTALGLANLAWIYYRQGKYEESEPLYVRALGIYERTVGPNHTSVAILLRDWARLHADLGDYARAEELLQRSAETWETVAGPQHPNLAECLDSLADLYVEQGKLVDAEPLYERALAIRVEKLGADHPSVAETLEAYTELLRSSGRAREAEEIDKKIVLRLEET